MVKYMEITYKYLKKAGILRLELAKIVKKSEEPRAEANMRVKAAVQETEPIPAIEKWH